MKQFKNMESCPSTENHSAALKNISNTERGLWAEKIVHDFLISKGWILHSHRFKYQYGEVDFVFERNHQVVLLEVKYLHNPWMSFQRISNEQLLRLKNNYLMLSRTEFKQSQTKLFLCFVERTAKIEWIDLMA